MGKIYKGDYFNNLKLNPSDKCEDGFITKMLQALHERCVYSLKTMDRPRGFHIELTKVERSKVRMIPRIISRWAASRDRCSLSYMTGKYQFLKAEEIRPRTKEFHIHLHIIADSVTYGDLQSLREALLPVAKMSSLKNRSLIYRPIKMNEATGECFTNVKTGNFERIGSPWNHELTSKDEFEDYFTRASYICKVRTKVSLSSWSCSHMASPENMEQRVKQQGPAISIVETASELTVNYKNQLDSIFSQLSSSKISNAKPIEMQSTSGKFECFLQ